MGSRGKLLKIGNQFDTQTWKGIEVKQRALILAKHNLL